MTSSAAASSKPSRPTAAANTTRFTGIRTLLRCAEERLTERQQARPAIVDADERHLEVLIAWRCAQQLRQIYHQSDPAAG